MTLDICERTVYIQADANRVAVAIKSLFEREGMVQVASLPKGRKIYYQTMLFGGLQSNHWGALVLPGAKNWCVVKTAPLDLLMELSPVTGKMRFLELCEMLAAPGFLIMVERSSIGRVLVECNATGDMRAMGWNGSYDDYEDDTLFDFYGTPLDPECTGWSFELLAELQPLLERCHYHEMTPTPGIYDMEQVCYLLAEELAGPNADFCMDSEAVEPLRKGTALAVEGGHALYFSWPAGDRIEPPPMERELKLELLAKRTHYLYPDGREILAGDVVFSRPRQLRGVVQGCWFMNGTDREPYVCGMAVQFDDELGTAILGEPGLELELLMRKEA